MTGADPTLPADLFGAGRPDRALRVVHALASARLRWSALTHRRAPVTAVHADRLPLIVARREQVADDVVALTFRAPDGGRLPRWHPGAHLDLELPSGRFRQYSLCGDPDDRNAYRIAVRRIDGGAGGSLELHGSVRTGSSLVARGPRNAFPFAVPGFGSPAHRLLFVAGGIGITPILPMLRLADRLGADWSLTYTGRSRASLPFRTELARYGRRVRIRTDDRDGLPDAAAVLPGLAPGTAVYCCGPTGLTDTVLAATRTLPGVEVHFERFGPAPVRDGVPFELELARTGEVLTVPADRSALDVLLTARPDRLYSCRQGFCRTCVTRVLAGDPDHRDGALTPAERAAGDLLPCVSRADGGRLVLDV
ncbi:PDR/VanB family oxidoreductase [Nocardia sp. NPDC057227]|uniref:PDR/VanB family oxidoreductase n=1 Tax=Nocardia sp. NPDC057227 TaxID=3346056 RepID=UPI0036305549